MALPIPNSNNTAMATKTMSDLIHQIGMRAVATKLGKRQLQFNHHAPAPATSSEFIQMVQELPKTRYVSITHSNSELVAGGAPFFGVGMNNTTAQELGARTSSYLAPEFLAQQLIETSHDKLHSLDHEPY